MDQFRIEGGNELRGELEISGSKNAALPMMAAALLAEGETLIHNVPRLRDVHSMIELLATMGVQARASGNSVRIDPAGLRAAEAPYELVRKMRASIYVLGPLLARHGRARVSLPGGCAWGPRPIDLHLKGFEALGAQVELNHGYIEARATRLRGAHIVLEVVSVGATANLLMAASLAEGTTTIENAAQEPHILSLGALLQKMGAVIEGLGSQTLRIQGQRSLRGAEVENRPDYIEAGTLAAAAAITGGELILHAFPLLDCQPTIGLLSAAGVRFEVVQSENERATVRVAVDQRLRGVNATTAPHPGFPTDMQAQLTALLSVAEGTSVITEGIYADRFSHVPELRRMGADLIRQGNVVVARGVETLAGAPVMATDLRASAALVLAGLAARGETQIRRVYHIDRGYEAIEEKLRSVGAAIRRVQD